MPQRVDVRAAAVPPPKEAVTAFLSYCRAKALSVRTIEYYDLRLRRFVEFLEREGLGLPDVDAGVIRAFMTDEQERCSSATANHSRTSVSALFTYLTDEEIIQTNPLPRVKRQKVRKTVIETFSPGQITALLATCKRDWHGVRDRSMILVLLDCGLRVSELVGVQLQDIDWADQTIRVLGKGNKERVVPFGQGTKSALTAWLTKRASLETESLWCNHYGEPMRRWRVRDMLTDRGAKAGITGVRCSPHTLRHTCAVSYLRAGGDLLTLQRLLGHSSVAVTQRYLESIKSEDVANAHKAYSPVDRLTGAKAKTGRRRLR